MNKDHLPVRVHDAGPLIDGDRHDERGGNNFHVSRAQIVSVGYTRYPCEQMKRKVLIVTNFSS